MKGISTLRKVDAVGRIVIPIELRKGLNIGKDDAVEILLEDNHIKIKKYRECNECLITGEITSQNRRYANNVVLSPLGAKILYNEIKGKQKTFEW
ncbi:AbrB family transcriptional regulator [Priestia megaterium]|uniref:AbrB family transcriptional regulator n=1 Tax=Priestia megaterium TaxID=1404 RepID=A0A3D8WYM5_PRIMG|nr:AbrB/MazE/SpoVT family DNA-binding domain-containing protein [Priestia megaterium]MDH3169353.1 AbrB/MazE/SpoVT family DNA-binding domain-containing protein [Priestia megaterium]RDZ11794.1 AbrB family transcriptional regulator [Priestia megaterium]